MAETTILVHPDVKGTVEALDEGHVRALAKRGWRPVEADRSVTKADLLARAAELGIEVDPKDTKADIAAAIAAHEGNA